MLAYAAHRRPVRRPSPSTLLLIAAGHVALLAAVMAIRMEVAGPPDIVITKVYPVAVDKPPPPPKPMPTVEPKPSVSSMTTPIRTVVLPMPDGPITIDLPQPTTPTVRVGEAIESVPGPLLTPLPNPLPPAAITRTAPRLLTSGDRLRPPYPESKRRMEQEGVLRLRLSVGPDGRVTTVEPVGAADSEFLAAARAHLIRAWRYAPAKEGGTPVATTLVITLRFELEE